MIGIVLFVVGLLLWLLGGYVILGIIIMVLGVLLMAWPGAPYGYSHYRGRRGPPV